MPPSVWTFLDMWELAPERSAGGGWRPSSVADTDVSAHTVCHGWFLAALCLVATGRMGPVRGDGAAWTNRRRQRIGRPSCWPTRLPRAWSMTSLSTSRARQTFQMSSNCTWGGGQVCATAHGVITMEGIYITGAVFLHVSGKKTVHRVKRSSSATTKGGNRVVLKKKTEREPRPGQCHATTLASAKLSSPSLVPISPMLASAPALPALSPPPSPPLP